MDMAESHVVSALANKRAEIAGMIARSPAAARPEFRADLVRLDANHSSICVPAMGAGDDPTEEDPSI